MSTDTELDEFDALSEDQKPEWAKALRKRQKEDAKENAAAPGAENGSPAAVKADAAGSPRLKPGLWRITTNSDGISQTFSMCIDAAIQEKMNVIGTQQNAGACGETTTKAVPGGGFSFRAVCPSSITQGGTAVIEGEISGDMNTRYTNRMTSTTTGAAVAHMNRSVLVTSEGIYEGACPAGMKAGDMETPGGRFNMIEMAEGAAKMGTQ